MGGVCQYLEKINTYDGERQAFTWMLITAMLRSVSKIRGYRDNQKNQPIAEGEDRGLSMP
jgi:hypothetical protein